jgi:hypothetical protein
VIVLACIFVAIITFVLAYLIGLWLLWSRLPNLGTRDSVVTRFALLPTTVVLIMVAERLELIPSVPFSWSWPILMFITLVSFQVSMNAGPLVYGLIRPFTSVSPEAPQLSLGEVVQQGFLRYQVPAVLAVTAGALYVFRQTMNGHLWLEPVIVLLVGAALVTSLNFVPAEEVTRVNALWSSLLFLCFVIMVSVPARVPSPEPRTVMIPILLGVFSAGILTLMGSFTSREMAPTILPQLHRRLEISRTKDDIIKLQDQVSSQSQVEDVQESLAELANTYFRLETLASTGRSEEADSLLREVNASVQRVRQTVQPLLQMARKSQVEATTADLEAMMERLTHRAQSLHVDPNATAELAQRLERIKAAVAAAIDEDAVLPVLNDLQESQVKAADLEQRLLELGSARERIAGNGDLRARVRKEIEGFRALSEIDVAAMESGLETLEGLSSRFARPEIRELSEWEHDLQELDHALARYSAAVRAAESDRDRRFVLKQGRLGEAYVPKVVGSEDRILIATISAPIERDDVEAEIRVDSGRLKASRYQESRVLKKGEMLTLVTSIWSESGGGKPRVMVSLRLGDDSEQLPTAMVVARPALESILTQAFAAFTLVSGAAFLPIYLLKLNTELGGLIAILSGTACAFFVVARHFVRFLRV